MRISHKAIVSLLLSSALLTSMAFAGPAKAYGQKANGQKIVDPAKLSFFKHIAPILDKRGCSNASCHGAFSGKGGFNISLMTMNPEQDYEPIALNDRGRRLNLIEPESSLFLLKPTNQVPHEGGQRIKHGDADYMALLEWIKKGAPYSPKDPMVTKLTIEPETFILDKQGEKQALKITAYFSDGDVMDVSAKTQYVSKDEGVAMVDEKGVVTRARWGGTVIIGRFLGKVVCSFVTLPREGDGSPYPEIPENNLVDKYVFAKLKKLNIVPSRLATDNEFVRRVYMDTIGTLPAPEEVEEFVDSEDPEKRSKLVDELLERPEYVDYRTLRLADILRIRPRPLGQGVFGERGATIFHEWVRDQVVANVPFDKFVRMMLTAKGSTYQVAPTNFYRIENSPSGRAETIGQAFLGVRLNCARCHKHPFDRWTTDDYWNFANFCSKVGTSVGRIYNEQVVYYNPAGRLNNQSITGANRGKPTKPVFLGGEKVEQSMDINMLEMLADWVTAPDNPFFARATVNRLWAHTFGRGIISPADDMRGTYPPSIDGLLEALSDYLIEHKFDIKQMYRLILNSRTYQLASETNETNELDDRFFSHYFPKPMLAQVMLDAINDVTSVSDRFGRYPMGTTAKQTPLLVGSYFMNIFGRSNRQFLAQLDPKVEPNLVQVLHLINGNYFNRKISARDGTVDLLLKSSATDEESIERLYLLAIARKPTKIEQAKALAYIKESESRRVGLEDLLWALLTSRQFYFIS